MAGTRVFRANASLVQGEVTGVAKGVRNYTGPASYATGGVATDLKTDESLNADPHLVNVKVILTSTGAPDSANYAEYDYTAKKIVVFVRTTGVELANAQDISLRTLRCEWESSQA